MPRLEGKIALQTTFGTRSLRPSRDREEPDGESPSRKLR